MLRPCLCVEEMVKKQGLRRSTDHQRAMLSAGFYEARRGCCGTGTVETSLLCNSKSPGTCRNATAYVFWDSVHPSEATNRVLADALLTQGIDLIV